MLTNAWLRERARFRHSKTRRKAIDGPPVWTLLWVHKAPRADGACKNNVHRFGVDKYVGAMPRLGATHPRNEGQRHLIAADWYSKKAHQPSVKRPSRARCCAFIADVNDRQ